MKILIDIGHPAHVHFFAAPIKIWQAQGCDVIITSRHKEIATDLLDAKNLPHIVLSSMTDGGFAGMAKELLQRDKRLYQMVRREKPDILTGIGGIFIAHVGLVSRTPSIVFYDTENAKLSNLITYPFCSLVAAPACYNAWLPQRHLKYPGYHELSYLHPDYFKPSIKTAVECGLDPEKPTFLIRTVSWQANHDISEQGWNADLLRQTVNYLAERGKVLISAEGNLPADLIKYRYKGAADKMHHLMGHLALFVGESATMASECAVMGVPAIYAAETGRGYTDEQEKSYGLVKNVRMLEWPNLQAALTEMLATPADKWRAARAKLLREKIDVARFVAELVTGYPESVAIFRKQFSAGGAV